MPDATPLDAPTAAKYAVHAMLACNCYHEADKVRFPVDEIGWHLVDMDGNATKEPTKEGWLIGFAYDLYESGTTNESIIAFRGTDSKQDYAFSNAAVPFSIPYKSAIKAVRKYTAKHPTRSLTAVGHSLGGGLALSASVHQGIPAVTFDPSPRIFDGLGDQHFPAQRVIIFQQGEVLEKLRLWLHKAYDVVDEKDVFETNFDVVDDDAHRIDLLAAGIVKMAATVDERFEPIATRLAMQPVAG